MRRREGLRAVSPPRPIVKFALPLTLGLTAVFPLPGFAGLHVVHSVDELVALAPMLAGTAGDRESPLHVHLTAGRYVLHDSVRILRSHVTLSGERGCHLILADGVNEPVIAIGTQADQPATTAMINTITIRDLEIDGNRLGQTSETSLARPWIRNNGIDVRTVSGLVVEGVTANNNRSGGLVISWNCADVRVTRCSFAGNHFDGIAFYASSSVNVSHCVMTRNLAAGISLDNDFRDSTFSECQITENGDVGIFVRFSSGLNFDDCTISSSGDWAVFLGHDERDRGVSQISLQRCRITANRGGIYLASVNAQQSRGVRVIQPVFSGNLVDGRANFFTSGAELDVSDAIEKIETPPGATDTAR